MIFTDGEDDVQPMEVSVDVKEGGGYPFPLPPNPRFEMEQLYPRNDHDTGDGMYTVVAGGIVVPGEVVGVMPVGVMQ